MPFHTSQKLAFLSLLPTIFSSPLPNAQVNSNAIPKSTNTTAMAQAAALSASQKTSVTSSSTSSSQINGLLAAASMAPIINMKVQVISGSLTIFEQGIATALNVGITASDTACSPMMVIFARGTTEPGNVGLFAGPPFFKALEEKMGSGTVGVQGVEYEASVTGFLQGGDAKGSAAMATLAESTIKKCPNSKIVMSGYSQGCLLVRNAAAMLPAATMAKVNSVVMFGDPRDGKPVTNYDAAKTLVVCHALDNICAGGDLILIDHLTYSGDAVSAAAFASSHAKA
ncbi:hypothetical protein WAI453_013017 [Rhynchosporium graminicola]